MGKMYLNFVYLNLRRLEENLKILAIFNEVI